jgi:hypothetical protein
MELATTGSVGVTIAPMSTDTQNGRPKIRYTKSPEASHMSGITDTEQDDEQPPVAARVAYGQAQGDPHEGDPERDERRFFKDHRLVSQVGKVEQAEHRWAEQHAREQRDQWFGDEGALLKKATEHAQYQEQTPDGRQGHVQLVQERSSVAPSSCMDKGILTSGSRQPVGTTAKEATTSRSARGSLTSPGSARYSVRPRKSKWCGEVLQHALTPK